jgi:hypothetical protein
MPIIFIKLWCAPVTKSGNTWTVQSASVETVLEIDDANNDGFISNAEWDAYTSGGGAGLDNGGSTALFDGNPGGTGTLYSATAYNPGDNVSSVINSLGNNFTTDPSDVGQVVCFCTGTQIATMRGLVAIEDLGVGDMVFTMDNGYRPIRWIGSNTLDAVDLQLKPNLAPVCINAGALGKGMPEQDLLVSPQHRVLVRSVIAQRMFDTKEVLIPAIKLCEIDGIAQMTDTTEVGYWHMLFDGHEIVYSNGAATESLFTAPEALKGVSDEAREEIIALFPEIAVPGYIATPARKIPEKGKFMKEFVARHAKNSKGFLT